MSKNLESLNSLTPAIYGEAIVAQLNATSALREPESSEEKAARLSAKAKRIAENPPRFVLCGDIYGNVIVECETCYADVYCAGTSIELTEIIRLTEAHTCE